MRRGEGRRGEVEKRMWRPLGSGGEIRSAVGRERGKSEHVRKRDVSVVAILIDMNKKL